MKQKLDLARTHGELARLKRTQTLALAAASAFRPAQKWQRAHTASLLVAAAGLGSLVFVPRAHAAGPYYWDGNGTTAGFGTAGGTWAAPTIGNSTQGWSTVAAGTSTPGSVTTATTDGLNFGNGATGLAAGSITVSGTVSAGNMTFASGSGNITLSGGTITLAAAETVTVDDTSDSITSIVGGAATSFTKAGSGTLTITAGTTHPAYTGTTTVNAGTLSFNLGTGGNGNNWAGGNFFINGASTLQFGQDRVDFSNLAFTFDATGGGTINLVSPALAFVLDGAGNSIVTNGGLADTISNGGTSGSINLGNAASSTTFNVALGTDATSDLNISAPMGNAGGVIKTGAGRMNLSGASTYAAGTMVSAGTVQAGVGSVTAGSGTTLSITSGPFGKGLLTISNAAVDLSTFSVAVGGLSGSGNIASSSTGTAGALTVVTASATPQTYSGAIADTTTAGGVTGNKTVSVTVAGNGMQTFLGTNLYSGGTTISSGTLEFGVTAAMPSTGTVTAISGSVLAVAVGGANQFTNATSGNGTLGGIFSGVGTAGVTVTLNSGSSVGIDTGSGSVSYSGNISNSGIGLVKLGANTLTLSSANTYTGQTTIDSGILSTGTAGILANGGTASSIGQSGNAAANLVLAGGTLQYAVLGAAETTDRLFTIAGGTTASALDASGNHSITFSNTGSIVVSGGNTSATLTLTGNGTGVLDPILANNGTGTTSLIKSGTGSWNIVAANTYSGGTTLSAGTLQLSGGNNRLLSTSSVTFAGSSTLDVGNTSQTLAGLSVSNANGVTGTVNGSGGTLTITGGSVVVGATTSTQNATVTAALDMTNLSNFTYNSSSGTFGVQGSYTGTGGTQASVTGVITLGSSNNITASTFEVNASLGTTGTSAVHLGQSNAINANTISVGVNGNGNLDLRGGLVSPTVTIRDASGGSSGNMTIGTSASQGTISTGNFTGATVDIALNSLALGIANRGSTAAPINPAVSGTFTINAGNFTAGTVLLGQETALTSGYTPTGTFNLNGGTANISTVTFADKISTAGNTVTGVFNLAGGATLGAKTIGTGTNGTGGTITRTFTWTDGTIQNYRPVTEGNLTINSGIAITLTSPGTHAFDIDTNFTGTVNSSLAGNGTLTKVGGGTLFLTASNSYSGGTTISSGTLAAAGSNKLGTGVVTVTGGNATSGGTLAVSDGATTTALTVTTGNETWKSFGGLTTRVFNDGTQDQLTLPTLTIDSSITTSAQFTVNASAAAGTLNPATSRDWTIATFSGLSGLTAPGAGNSTVLAQAGVNTSAFVLNIPSSEFTGSTYGTGGAPYLVLEEVSGTSFSLDVVYNATPEPGTAMLMLAVGPVLLRRRRRRVSGVN